MGEIDDAIERGDVKAIVKAGIGAMIAEGQGRYCQCSAPDMTGRKSYLCFACGLPNMERKSEIEAALQQPHPYEVIEKFRGGLWEGTCCDFCAWPKAHPLHQPDSKAPEPKAP